VGFFHPLSAPLRLRASPFFCFFPPTAEVRRAAIWPAAREFAIVAQMAQPEHFRPNYLRVWLAFLKNSFSRELSFRGNFLIELFTNAFWITSQILLFEIIYSKTPGVAGWTREQYMGFMGTGLLINALVEFFFMPNCANFSELVRTGNLDFALLKPIDTQFLVSLEKIDLGVISEVLGAALLLGYGVYHASNPVTLMQVGLFLLLIMVSVAFYYSLMIALASTAIWLGRNQTVYEFWFYITVFGRYPSNIYGGGWVGQMIWFGFSFIIPILVVVTVPAQVLLGKALEPNRWILIVAPIATLAALFLSRKVFQSALASYRSASS
jgi:ABC-2 type transport system permease protein